MKRLKTTYKLGFALLGLSAIVTEIATLVNENAFNAGNFFSFFTIQSNILIVGVLIIGALYAFAGKKSSRFEFYRGAATFYMAVTGVVFALLLSSIEGVRLTAVPWDNIVLHYILPVIAVADWIIDPPQRRIALKKAMWWLVFPIAYFVYSLIRGAIGGWYPYPFLNPAFGGYESVVITAILITVCGIVGVGVLSLVGKSKKA